MFLLDYVKNKLTSSTDPTQINVDEVVTEDGFVMVLEVQRQKADQENFEPIEMPVIEPVEDAMMEVDRVVRISPTNEIETRRRKELIVARAKTAARKRLEKEVSLIPAIIRKITLCFAVFRRPREWERRSIPQGSSETRLQELPFRRDSSLLHAVRSPAFQDFLGQIEWSQGPSGVWYFHLPEQLDPKYVHNFFRSWSLQ